MSEKKGYIYIMTNPALIDMVKIGYATNVEERRKQLSTTALPYEYEVYATYETNGNLEDKKLHQLIDNLNSDLRVSKNREFYVMTPEQAYQLLEAIAIISGTSKKLRKSPVPTGLFDTGTGRKNRTAFQAPPRVSASEGEMEKNHLDRFRFDLFAQLIQESVKRHCS